MPPHAFDTIICAECGEVTVERYARVKHGKIVCQPCAEKINQRKKMKIAAVSEDGVTISQHFGRAPFYVVVTVEDGKIVAHEKRDKMGHNQFGGEIPRRIA